MQECSERWGLELISHVAEKENFLLRTSQPNGSCEEAFSDSAFPLFVWEAPKLQGSHQKNRKLRHVTWWSHH